jgi:DivIVA domain-containing protein
VGKKSLGYNVTQVEAFLDEARLAYDQPDAVDDGGHVVSDTDDDSPGTGELPRGEVTGAAERTGGIESVHGAESVHGIGAQKAATAATRIGPTLTAERIRHTAFSMHKGGYSPEHVDAALERLEDAFAARERDQASHTGAGPEWTKAAEGTAEVLVARLSRAPGHRFTRTSVLAVGYKRVDVDRLANKLVKYFHDGRELTVDEVRTAVFRPERGGYREAQVDLVLDSVVDVMLAVR